MDIDLLAALVAISGMVTIVVALFAFYGAAVPSASLRGRLDGLMSGTSVVEGVTPAALRQMNSSAGFIKRLFGGEVTAKLAYELERAEMTLSPGEFIIARFALAGAGFAGPLFLVEGMFGYAIAGAGALIGYNLPKIYMNRQRKARIEKLNAQLPEALTLVSNALKAGFGLLQALNVAVDQIEHPLSTEFARAIHEMNVGSSTEEALLALGERSESYDLDIVVTAILVQRTVGGNLGEILDTVAHTMRERIRIRGEIKTLTAQQKLTGLVIGFLPIGVGLLFYLMSPEYITPLFTTFIGKSMIVTAVILEIIGVMVIQRILNIEV